MEGHPNRHITAVTDEVTVSCLVQEASTPPIVGVASGPMITSETQLRAATSV